MTVLAAVVGSTAIVLVEAEYDEEGNVVIIKDETFNLEDGERHEAYAVMHKRVSDRLKKDIEVVIVKASSGGQYAAKTAILHAAELRGVFLSAVPKGVEVRQLQKKNIGKSLGSKKFDNYLKDDNYFDQHFSGESLRRGSREAALLILSESE